MSNVSQRKKENCLISGARRGTHTSLRNLTHFTASQHLDCNFYLACLVHFISEEPVIQATYLRTLWKHFVLEINHFDPRHQGFQQDGATAYCAFVLEFLTSVSRQVDWLCLFSFLECNYCVSP